MTIFRFFFLFVFSLWPIMTMAQEKFSPPDIIIDSKLDFNWSEMLIQKVRRLMVNKGLGDPLNGKIEKDIVFQSNIVTPDTSEATKVLLKEIELISGFKLIGSKAKVTIKKLYYSIDRLTTELSAFDHPDGMILRGDFAGSNIKVGAEEVQFSISIPTQRGDVSVLDFSIQKPYVMTQDQDELQFKSSIQVLESADFISLKVLDSSFQNLSSFIQIAPENVKLGVDGIIMKDIEFEMGGHKLQMTQDRLVKFVQERQDSIKTVLLEAFANGLKKGVGNTILKAIENKQIDKQYWLRSKEIISTFRMEKLSTATFVQNLQLSLSGDFCTKGHFTQMKQDCVSQNLSPARGQISQDDYERSLADIKSQLDNGEANLVASVSENYMNKLLLTTYEAGLWKTTLGGAGVTLGDKKVFIRLVDKGKSAKLYLDIVYQTSLVSGLFLGAKEIHFPLALDVSMRMQNKNGYPNLIIHLDDVDLSKETLLKGIPQQQLTSNIKDLHLQDVVTAKIHNKLKTFIGKDIISLAYPDFQGLGLETVRFESDGLGRMGAYVKLQELLAAPVEK